MGKVFYMLLKNEKVKNAICLGFLCSVAYLAVYYARNILGAVNPQIIEGGFYTKDQLGSISSTYLSAMLSVNLSTV